MALEIVEEMKSPYRTTLVAFSRALTREAHVLTRQPDLLWQQLHNRLQWEEEVVNQTHAPELARCSFTASVSIRSLASGWESHKAG